MAQQSVGARQWLGLVAIALGVSMIVVDTTIVNVITPSIIDDIKINSSQAQWIQESYAIIFAAMLLVFGRASDLLGARRVFIAGVVVFGVTSLLAGLAQSGNVLIAARFLQGIGGAMLLPTSLALLNQTFTGKARGQAFAVWGSTIGAAAAVGPVVGGWLAEHASWRWAFGINVPLVVVIFVLSLVCIAPSKHVKGRIDVLGSILSVIALAALSFGLVEGRTYGWLTSTAPFDVFGRTWNDGLSPAFVALLVALVFLALFVARQVLLSREDSRGEPLMDMRLFRITSFRNGNIATLLIGLGEFGIISVLPLWLQFTLGYSALESGVALLPLAFGSFFASGLSFALAETLGALGLVRIGLALEAVGLLALGVIVATTDAPWWSVSIPLFFYGVGVGFATAQVTNVVLTDVPGSEAGQASGVQSTFRQLGSALGIAALTTVFYSTLSGHVTSDLQEQKLPADQIDRFAAAVTDSAGAIIAQLASNPATAVVARAAKDAMTDGIALGSYVAAGFLLVGLLATLLIPAAPTTSEQTTPEREKDAVS